jgi:hypothetical protein
LGKENVRIGFFGLFIDASREFIKVTNSNKLTRENIDKIVAAYTGRNNTPYFVKLVPNGDIADQGYNLSVVPMWSGRTNANPWTSPRSTPISNELSSAGTFCAGKLPPSSRR